MIQPERRIGRSDLGMLHVALIPSNKIMDFVVDVLDVENLPSGACKSTSLHCRMEAYRIA